MKKITYRFYGENDPVEYLITETEFNKMLKDWKNGDPYWCPRLSVMLNKNFSELKIRDRYRGFDKILINKDTREELGVKLVDGELAYYALREFQDGRAEAVELSKMPNYEKTMKNIKDFIPIDNFYDNLYNAEIAKKLITDEEYNKLLLEKK